MIIDFKKEFRMLCFISLLFCIGCDSIYRILDEKGAEEKEIIGELLPFQLNETVLEVQTLLKIYGYNIGEADGVLGANTRNNIEKFQKDNVIKPSRFIDFDTYKKIRMFKDNGFVVNSKINIEKVQEALFNAGFDVGGIDGKFGPLTKQAVLDFQRSKGLIVDGRIGFKTLNQMARYTVP